LKIHGHLPGTSVFWPEPADSPRMCCQNQLGAAGDGHHMLRERDRA
jgi:hypothetical protein